MIDVALENHEAKLEDTFWLRPINDAQHINLVELEAKMKVLQWQASMVHLYTDSVCMYQ